MKNKKVVWIVIGIVSVALIALSITYAYWQITASQQGVNEISSACLDISLVDTESENTGVTLQDQYPLSDTEGAKLKPYKFTVTNNCDVSVDYQIALESIGDSTTALKASSIKAMLDDNDSMRLNEYVITTSTISGAYASYKLGAGTLSSAGDEGSTATHELRLWIDEDAPISENNKTYTGKISVAIGQNIFNPLKEGTLAYSLLNAYGGKKGIQELSAKKEDRVVSTNIEEYFWPTWQYFWGTTYTVDVSGNYKLAGTIVQASPTECRNGAKADGTAVTCGKYTIQNRTSETGKSKVLYEITDLKTSGSYVKVNTRKYVNDFSLATTKADAGMYKAQDDYGTSYYYRGNITNNYVKFGVYSEDTEITYAGERHMGFGCYYDEYGEFSEDNCVEIRAFETADECNNLVYESADGYDTYYCEPIYESAAGKDIFWKIVRINGDGTIRMIYDGLKMEANGAYNDAAIGSSVYNDTNSVDYVYDDNKSSTIKQMVDTWYINNLEENYSKYISDTVFCNDREIVRTQENRTYYVANDRIVTNQSPILTCTRDEDKLTVTNGKLSKPIGLMTSDEFLMAGLTTESSANHLSYIGANSSSWTMTPNYYGSTVAIMFSTGGSHFISETASTSSSYAVRPVINLKADVEFEYEENEDGLGVYTIITD